MKKLALALVMSVLAGCAAMEPKVSGITAINFNSEPGPVVKVAPRYPNAALAQGLEGNISMSFVVGEDGKPKDIKVIESVGEPLESAALRALEKAFYLPKHSGKSVTSVAEFTLNK
ncbi:energy transducer TonB [Microbulbifer aestuariivivens]|uniref:energy transducer TonB n=1 Tax=Microbulbifer aestuariivivens TaxID=1908308 RepID=UPI0031E70FA5